MALLIIVNGLAGAGKSTAVKEFAKKHGFVVIKQDTFLFELNAIREPKKFLTKEQYTLAIENMMSCVKNYMDYRRDIIIEGALVAISKNDPLDIRQFINLGRRRRYRVKIISFTASDTVRYRRMQKKKNIVPKKIDRMLKEATKVANEKMYNVTMLDTSNYPKKAVLKRLTRILS